MVSKVQDNLINERIKKVVITFLEKPNITIKELSDELKIPTSTIQRDLNNFERISNIFGIENTPRILESIKIRLMANKKEGVSKGGMISTINNITLRDNEGKFVTVVKK